MGRRSSPSTRVKAVATPILLLYIGLPGLAGWTPEICPALLDPADLRAVMTLRLPWQRSR